jgi:hypothetical protein
MLLLLLRIRYLRRSLIDARSQPTAVIRRQIWTRTQTCNEVDRALRQITMQTKGVEGQEVYSEYYCGLSNYALFYASCIVRTQSCKQLLLSVDALLFCLPIKKAVAEDTLKYGLP